MHALVAATLGYGSTHKEPFDKLEKGGTLLCLLFASDHTPLASSTPRCDTS